MQPPLKLYLEQLHTRIQALNSGKVATYIPALAEANPAHFGICIVTADGYRYAVGDCEQSFTVQSISKPLTYAMALADRGREAVVAKVGVEPSGEAFNSISLHPTRGTPLNPMINAGAIAITGLVAGATPAAQWQRIQDGLALFAGRPLTLNEKVYRSESETGYRNRAISWLLRNAGVIEGEPEPVLENYFRQCSVEVTCIDLAVMAATLANGGTNPLTGLRAARADVVESVLSVMSTCGMYNYAGEWLFEVGIPAKSGVSGGIMAVLPGKFGIAVYSPPLDERGNCLRGIAVCETLTRDFGLHLFASNRTAALVVNRMVRGIDLPSGRQRPPEAEALLQQRADAVRVLMLQGDLGFDGAEYISRLIAREDSASFFVLDLQGLSWIAPVAARSLHQIRLQLRAVGRQLVFARLRQRPELIAALKAGLMAGEPGYLSFEDNRLAVEWCENQLLAEELPGSQGAAAAPATLADFRLLAGLNANELAALGRLAEPTQYAAEERVFAAGDEQDDRVFFILSGEVSVRVPALDGGQERVATLCQGMVFGEMALVDRLSRNAEVQAETATQCLVIRAAQINALATSQPQIKSQILHNLVYALADQLSETNRLVGVLAS